MMIGGPGSPRKCNQLTTGPLQELKVIDTPVRGRASHSHRSIPSAFRPLSGIRFILGQAEALVSGRFFGGSAVQTESAHAKRQPGWQISNP